MVAVSLLVSAGFATLGAAPGSAATSVSEHCQVHSDGVTHCEVTTCYTELGGLVDCVGKEYCYKKGTAQVTGCGDDSGDSTRGDGDLSANPPETRPGLKSNG